MSNSGTSLKALFPNTFQDHIPSARVSTYEFYIIKPVKV